MTIVFLNPIGAVGGAEMCLLDLIASLRAARPDWRLVVVLGDDGPLRAAVEDWGATCTVLPMPRSLARLGDAGKTGRRALAARGPAAAVATCAYLGRLKRLLRAERPDLVQTNGMKAHVLGAWATAGAIPVIWHLHDYLGSRQVMARLLRWSARRSISVAAVSQSVADDARRVLGPRVPVRTIYNAVDLERFAPGPGRGDRLDEASGFPPAPSGTVRVGLVATFATWKGHEVFLEAVRRIAPERPCRFYIVGGPIYRSAGSQWSRDELRVRAEALGVGDRVGLAGHWADPAEALRALDIVVHASTRPEPFGRVIVEGMACGRAVIAMRAGGAAELFEDGVSALGCPPGDAAALAAAIERLSADAELRERLGAAGRQIARERFDRARLAEEWAAVFAGVRPRLEFEKGVRA